MPAGLIIEEHRADVADVATQCPTCHGRGEPSGDDHWLDVEMPPEFRANAWAGAISDVCTLCLSSTYDLMIHVTPGSGRSDLVFGHNLSFDSSTRARATIKHGAKPWLVEVLFDVTSVEFRDKVGNAITVNLPWVQLHHFGPFGPLPEGVEEPFGRIIEDKDKILDGLAAKMLPIIAENAEAIRDFACPRRKPSVNGVFRSPSDPG